MSGDTERIVEAIADIMTLSGRLKLQSEEVECKLCASSLLIASKALKRHAISMQNKLNNELELKCGIKFEKCEIEDYFDKKE